MLRKITHVALALLSTAPISAFSATGNISVTGTIDNPGDVDVYAYEVNDTAGTDPAFTDGQDRIMIRMDSASHVVQRLTAYNPSTQEETWTLVAYGDGDAYGVFATPGSTQYFRVVNVASPHDPDLEYTLYLSNPPHRVSGGSIVSNDSLTYTPWTFFGIEARTGISFSGTMVDQYDDPVPYSPQTLSVRHSSGVEIDQIQTNASGWYSHTVTFSPCTGGGMILGAASSTPSGYNYPEKSPAPWYGYYGSGPWYSAWPMLDTEPYSGDVFGMNPAGLTGGISPDGAFGFNQDCN